MRFVYLLVVVCGLMSACAAPRSNSPYANPAESQRRPAEAERLTLKAAELIDSDPAEAEKLLREALTLDLFHGPAHNNLGVVHLNRGAIYEAASEFEFARKLMPGLADPRVNLALTLERAGHAAEAMNAYTAALEVMPEYLPALQGLTCLQLRSGTPDARTRGRLSTIALRGETSQWREWARGHLASESPSPQE